MAELDRKEAQVKVARDALVAKERTERGMPKTTVAASTSSSTDLYAMAKLDRKEDTSRLLSGYSASIPNRNTLFSGGLSTSEYSGGEDLDGKALHTLPACRAAFRSGSSTISEWLPLMADLASLSPPGGGRQSRPVGQTNIDEYCNNLEHLPDTLPPLPHMQCTLVSITYAL